VSGGDYYIPEKKFKAWHQELKALIKNRKENWTNFFYFNLYAYSASKAGFGEMKDIINKQFNSGESI
jgi:hypothetical protein